MFAQQSLLRAVALALLLSAAYGQFVTDGLVRDREGLLALKNAVTDFGNSKIASWRPTGNPCFPKPWRHVLCGGGRVVEINLANLQVAGNLPAKLRLMDKLITLNMDGNKFTGGIPSSWAARSSFPNLKILSLSGNELSGELPNWNRAGAWRSLQVVDLSNNNFHGGLPANWLGKQRALRNVQTLDLSNNYLGRANGTIAGDALTRAQWCETEADASLYTGSGWCPAGTPIAGTLASMTSLDLSNNGLSGEIPAKWPVMMPQMQYLMLHFNNLHKEVDSAAVASVLPKTWSDLRRKAFPSLSILTLYPGNDYLCSVPDFDGFFDVNVDASYQVFDNIGTAYGGDNPRRCPTAFTNDNAPTSPTMSKTAPTWGFVNPGTVWGFKVTFSRLSTEGQQWSTVPDWSSVLLRTYINSDDGFDADDVSAQGLVCDSDVCTLTFADITSSSLVDPTATLVQWGYSKLKMTVETINLDRVASSTAESPEINV